MKITKTFLLNEDYGQEEYSEEQIKQMRLKCIKIGEFMDEYLSANGDLFSDSDNQAISTLSEIREDDVSEDAMDYDYLVSTRDNNLTGELPAYVKSFIGRDFNLTYINWGEDFEIEFPGVIEIDTMDDIDELRKMFGKTEEEEDFEKTDYDYDEY